jgi:NADH-quinone oxidoreductase subunit L
MLNLTWTVPLFPLLAFAAIVLFTNRNRRLSSSLAIAAIGLSTVVGWGIFLTVAFASDFEPVDFSIPWMPTGGTVFDIGVMVDTFTAAMLFMVPFVCLMIFIYSQGYMAKDPRYSRFFAYMALFAAGMLGLVVADNLLLAFISWEIMGLCSYFLIGFWSYRSTDEQHIDDAQVARARAACLKAFITTRVGDILLFAGMALLYSQTGNLAFRRIFTPETIAMLKATQWNLGFLGIWPAVTVIALLIFGGAVGKSAQFPLHVWLPDAMEGPTPVSALIHAATMVAAGVYLVARTLPLFIAIEGSPALWWVAVIGAITAFFGATIGLAQDDIKRVLAYSTISQLGYMMMALGLGGFVAAIFHLVTHAFFKALLFLGSGSVIQGMERGHHQVSHSHHDEHEYFSPNDMKTMGGLRDGLPSTFWAYWFGTLALTGIFPFAGFWSKDEILAEAFHKFMYEGAFSLPFWVWLAGTLGALVTALYMGRQMGLVWYGEARHEAAQHAQESPASMTVPLMVLAAGALLLGVGNVPFLGGWLHHFMGEVYAEVGFHPEAVPFSVPVAGISTVLAVGGLLLGTWLYKDYRAGQVEPFQRALGPLFSLLRNKYYVDEFYHLVIIRPVVWFANFCFEVDNQWVVDPLVNLAGAIGRLASEISLVLDTIIVDGAVNAVGDVARGAGGILRYSQTGRVQNYLLVVAITVLLLVGMYLAL